MQAVILAGGEGCRLRPLTKNRPKAMINVGDRPLIKYVIDTLLENGIRDIIVVVGYRKEQVMGYLNRLDEGVTVVIQERQLGTAHALACAKDHITGDFLVLPGDNWIDRESIGRLKEERNTMLIKEHHHPSNFGVVEISDNRVVRIIEKPRHAPSQMVSTGILSLTPKFFDYTQVNELPDALNQMINEGNQIRAIDAIDWQDALVPWDLLHLNTKLLKQIHARREGTVNRNVVLRGPVKVGKGTVIHPQTVITGPVVIGEDCEIGPQVTIMPATSIGSRVTIAPHSHLAGSILMDDVVVGPNCHLEDTIIGERCNLSSHIVTQVDSSAFEIVGQFWKGRFGAILGDDVTAAPFTVFRNCIVGNNVVIREGRVIRSKVPNDSLVM